MLDHILLGCNDLDRGIAFFEENLGVRAAIGGVHPGRGTRNALLALGERRYLEIIAPDPAQTRVPDFAAPLLNHLKSLTMPALVGWAAHPRDLEALAAQLKAQGIAFDGPRAGSRQRPDGRLLKWKTLNLHDDHNGVLPFFIAWDADSPHPSTDAPVGCRLERFAITDPDPAALGELCAQLSLGAPIEKGSQSRLLATIAGSRKILDLSS
ncbi:MAG TPA: VOC family protein [Terriglobales bacterium]|nr:VOC family protein [Terriglobales bacterium]